MMVTPIHLIVKRWRNYEMCSIYSCFDRQRRTKIVFRKSEKSFLPVPTTGKRENLQRLIQDAKTRKFDVILAKELSRLARNGGLSYQIRDIARDNSVHIVTLDNAINTIDGNGEMFGLYAWM